MKSLIKKLLRENLNNDIVFVRTNNFDNRGTIRKLPYDGIQCWCILREDLDKYINELELWGGNKRDVEMVNPVGFKTFAVNYPMAHKYVMGESNEIPKLESFNVNKHRLKFIKQHEKSMLEYIADLTYQIILTKIIDFTAT